MKIYDLVVAIFRAQTYTEGHHHVVKNAILRGNNVMIFLGSHEESRRPDLLPFTTEERIEMIRGSLSEAENAKVKIVGVHDFGNTDLWVDEVNRLVTEHFPKVSSKNIALIGHAKDGTSYYLKKFPFWKSINVANYKNISATPIRERYFDPNQVAHLMNDDIHDLCPTGTVQFLERFIMTETYKNLSEEFMDVKAYRKSWECAPFPPIFVTTDNVVFHDSGRILLIKRGNRHGKDQWALAGGFFNHDDPDMFTAALRELKEETNIKLPEDVLRGSLLAREIVDTPNRSMRGRTITHVYAYHVKSRPVREPKVGESEADFLRRREESMLPPKVRAADDAADAKWFKLNEITRDMMFEDHFYIIQRMKAYLPQ